MSGTMSDDDALRLLGRPVRARLTHTDRRAFHGRGVLITGAGGSIGSAIARDMAACGAARLVLVDQSEYQLVTIERELRERWPAIELVPALIDVTRPAFVRRVAERARPTTIFHAAAYKHVTVAERAVSAVAEANVIGTAVVATVAEAIGARFVLISSDKAASPEGVMGATKRLAELAVLARTSQTFKPAVVRFGNVIGSSGSLLEIMQAAIASDRPIPVTDPRATRYFMTAGEAVALVVRADRAATGREIFWLDVGHPVRIGELVERVVADALRATGRKPRVEIVGLRPGEKLHEQLADRALRFERTPDRRMLRAAHPAVDRATMDLVLGRLARAIDRADDAAALTVMTEAVDGFIPSAHARQCASPAEPTIAPASTRARSVA